MGVLDGIDRPALAAVLPGLGSEARPSGRRRQRDLPPRALPRVRPDGAFLRAGDSRRREAEDRPDVGRRGGGEGDRDDARGLRPPEVVGAQLHRETSRGATSTTGDVDVIVTDGFTGNVILKVSESLAHMVEEALKQEITRSLQASMGFLLSKDAFRAFKKRLDYSEIGGVPLLGVKGACLIGHGRSTAKAVRNAIRAADDFARARHPGEDPREGARVRSGAAQPLTSRRSGRGGTDVSRHDRGHRRGRSRADPDERRPREDGRHERRVDHVTRTGIRERRMAGGLGRPLGLRRGGVARGAGGRGGPAPRARRHHPRHGHAGPAHSVRGLHRPAEARGEEGRRVGPERRAARGGSTAFTSPTA